MDLAVPVNDGRRLEVELSLFWRCRIGGGHGVALEQGVASQGTPTQTNQDTVRGWWWQAKLRDGGRRNLPRTFTNWRKPGRGVNRQFSRREPHRRGHCDGSLCSPFASSLSDRRLELSVGNRLRSTRWSETRASRVCRDQRCAVANLASCPNDRTFWSVSSHHAGNTAST